MLRHRAFFLIYIYGITLKNKKNENRLVSYVNYRFGFSSVQISRQIRIE